MSATDEKKLILRNTKLFATATEAILAQVGEVLETVTLKAGETLFEKGDWGTSMYIVVEGQVRAHDGELIFNYLNKGDIFGEMAALDSGIRSTSITAEVNTTLFRLDQKPLYQLMSRQIEVVREIIHVLCQHLRDRVQDMAQDFQYIQQFNRVIAAAQAVEAGVYEPDSLDTVALRTDELGQLARVFQKMAREVYAREQQLKQQVQELRIEIDKAKQAREVSEITETDYFQRLRGKAKGLRRDEG